METSAVTGMCITEVKLSRYLQVLPHLILLIIVFVSIYQYLPHLSGITVKLQNSALDIVDAYEMIEGIRNLYKLERQNVDNNFQRSLT